MGEDETEASSDANQEGASGFALKTNIWTEKDVLFVHFLNPKILEQKKWENEYGVLNISNILSWAEAWNTKKYPNIPTFKKTDRPDRADIRVKFEGIIYMTVLNMNPCIVWHRWYILVHGWKASEGRSKYI